MFLLNIHGEGPKLILQNRTGESLKPRRLVNYNPYLRGLHEFTLIPHCHGPRLRGESSWVGPALPPVWTAAQVLR